MRGQYDGRGEQGPMGGSYGPQYPGRVGYGGYMPDPSYLGYGPPGDYGRPPYGMPPYMGYGGYPMPPPGPGGKGPRGPAPHHHNSPPGCSPNYPPHHMPHHRSGDRPQHSGKKDDPKNKLRENFRKRLLKKEYRDGQGTDVQEKEKVQECTAEFCNIMGDVFAKAKEGKPIDRNDLYAKCEKFSRKWETYCHWLNPKLLRRDLDGVAADHKPAITLTWVPEGEEEGREGKKGARGEKGEGKGDKGERRGKGDAAGKGGKDGDRDGGKMGGKGGKKGQKGERREEPQSLLSDMIVVQQWGSKRKQAKANKEIAKKEREEQRQKAAEEAARAAEAEAAAAAAAEEGEAPAEDAGEEVAAEEEEN